MKTTVHIISHSHWDREWYRPFEQHRVKLIRLMDDAMELFDTDEGYRSYHLDGQTIVMDDYLEIKPQNKEKLEKFVKEGRFAAGPWYILQDEFLTSGEANVRNLQTGIREAKKYGSLCKTGYFPDAFGNAGQMPQLLKQAGMEAVAFGRGVKPVGFNNITMEGGKYESAYSEMNWQSPDGSSLLGILFANWYNNGMEIPVEEEKAKAYWDEKLARARAFASTSQLLFMNGCDHQPVQKDLTAAIRTAQKLYPDIEFVHSDFDTYVKAVKEELGDREISTVTGELTSQETDGRWTLVNTTSSWVDLKQMNRRGETVLEKEAEPMSVFAAINGGEYPEALLRYSWKKLMQNHPHDSICGCSVDEVNAEIKTRFDKSRQVAEEMLTESMKAVAGKIDTASLKEGTHPFAVFNTTGWERTGIVELVLDYRRIYTVYYSREYNGLKELPLPALAIKDSNGNLIPATIEDMGVVFGYDLPDDKFRQPYLDRQVKITFEAKDVPALGYALYYMEENQEAAKAPSLVSSASSMENDYLKVEIHADGSYSLTEKESGRVYSNIGYYEETGDIGNEYVYLQDGDGKVLTTKGLQAAVELVEDTPYRASFKISHVLSVPEAAADEIEEVRKACVDVFDRTTGRSSRMTDLPITTVVTLEKSAHGVKVATTIDNTAKDHRVRVMVPTGLDAKAHYADSVFEVVKRNNRHSSAWENPSGCEHQQDFVAMEDEKGGILVANFGLYEYEVLPDQDNTIAVTLLRGVAEMGDWGYFPTPAAQLLGSHTLQYEILPFAAGKRVDAYTEGYQFQTGLLPCKADGQEGTLPAAASFFTWEGKGLNLTGLKKKEDADDIMVRFVNNTEEPVVLTFAKQQWFANAYKSNVIEENLSALKEKDGSYQMEIRPFEIATIGLTR